jgi:hypothetical protein
MRHQRFFVLLSTELRRRSIMKVRVALLVVSIAGLLAALACAQGITPARGGGPGAQGIIVEANVKPRPPHWF